jgi:hypothetical protein
VDGGVAEPVGDQFAVGAEVMRVGDFLAVGVDGLDQPAGGVVFVADRADAARVLDLDQAVVVVVEEAGAPAFGVGVAGKVAVDVVGVGL